MVIIRTVFVAEETLYWPYGHHANHHDGEEGDGVASHP